MTLPIAFETHLKQNNLILPNEKIFVACSGGPDSVALLHLLITLQKTWKFKVGVLHFNHRLRQAAKTDEQFVRKLAKKFRVPVYAGSASVKTLSKKEKYSQEEAARAARYDFFEKIAAKRKISKILTAHTQDDQAETILMRVLQGTGLRGLCGIRTQMKIGDLVFVRPFLNFSKKEILKYLQQNRIAYRKDSSNQSEKYLRNKIRLKLIPWLEKEFHPKIKEAAARVPSIVSRDAEFLETMENQSWKQVFLAQKKQKISLRRAHFLKLAPSLQFRVVDRALRKLDAKSGLSFEAWQTLKGFLGRPAYRHSLPKDIDFVLTPSKLMLYKK